MEKFVKFHNGLQMPLVGYGMWQSDNQEDLEAGLNAALEAGYRLFDTAWGYRNENVLGRVMQGWFEKGLVKREDLFITSKLPPTGHHPDRVERFLKDTLKDLQLDYVDLYLVHNPASIETVDDGFAPKFNKNGKVVLDTSSTLENTWKTLEEQVKNGRCKSIGASNFSIEQIERICKSCEIKPVNLQIELNAAYPRKKMREVCAKNGITVTSFASLGSPGRKVYKGYTATGAESFVKVPTLLEDAVVVNIASKHGKSPAQVLLRFLGQQGIAVIPKSVNANRIKSNFDLYSFQLDASDMAALDKLDLGKENGTWGFDWKNALPGIGDHPEFQLEG